MTETNEKQGVWSARMAQAMLARDVFKTVRGHYYSYQQRRAERGRYFVTVEESDDIFSQIQQWILDEIPADEQRTLGVETRHSYDEDTRSVMIVFDGEQPVTLHIAGYDVQCELTRRKPKAQHTGPEDDVLKALGLGQPSPQREEVSQTLTSGYTASLNAVFTCDSVEARDAVLDKLRDLSANMAQVQPRFYNATNYGHFRAQSINFVRPLDSVVLADDQRERIVADLEYFLSTEERYLELGLPWHRGYLFYGPPGTGKTSLAKALAAEFRFNVYYINLAVVESDAKLVELFANIDSGRSFLVLEDIDIVQAAKDRTDDKKGVTLGGLLNALDGIATPHGLITLMTTNDREILDPALIRPGRVDFELNISYVTDKQFQDLCRRFIGREVSVPPILGKITPAEVVGLFKNGDTDDLDRKLHDLVAEKNDIDCVQHEVTTV
jgi:hypothetical protein